MKTSDAGLQFITKWEGEVLHPYRDIVGVLTVGVGHVIRRGESFGKSITHEQSQELLRQDVGVVEDAVNSYVIVPLTQDQFDALASFAFNVGTGALKHSTLLRLLNAGDAQGAADQFLAWCKAGGKTQQGLLARRKSERELFLRQEAV